MTRFEIVESVVRIERDKEFIYGQSDCFFFGLRMVDAVQGTDLVKEYSGEYKSLKGARAAMKKRGYKSLVSVFKKHLKKQTPALCVTGDLGVLNFNGDQHIAVHVGNGFLTRTESGFSLHTLNECLAGFKV